MTDAGRSRTGLQQEQALAKDPKHKQELPGQHKNGVPSEPATRGSGGQAEEEPVVVTASRDLDVDRDTVEPAAAQSFLKEARQTRPEKY